MYAWKTLNGITASKNISIPGCISADGVTYTEPKSIAQALILHFTTIGSKWANLLKEKLGNHNFARRTKPVFKDPTTNFVFELFFI